MVSLASESLAQRLEEKMLCLKHPLKWIRWGDCNGTFPLGQRCVQKQVPSCSCRGCLEEKQRFSAYTEEETLLEERCQQTGGWRDSLSEESLLQGLGLRPISRVTGEKWKWRRLLLTLRWFFFPPEIQANTMFRGQKSHVPLPLIECRPTKLPRSL